MTKESRKSKHRLILLRHGKSAWPEGVADEARPLSERGRRAAPVIGAYMEHETLIPDLVLVSPATRAQQTWDLVRDELPADMAERTETKLYEVPAETIVDAIRSVEASCRTLLVVGHNPGMEDAAAMLAGGGEAGAIYLIKEKFPTAGLAVIDFDIEGWNDLAAGSGYLERFVTPRSLA
ncbi:SixA phosphatase family protein [Pararhizobium gei]|uniref:SixA phosphatase family protein n=1 Tax=Pararhizobium gei TaxID=1395951 RepID=UPI0023DAD1DC|nr:histidine phosphatase family protein [Rhizobium gei]